MTDLKSYQVLIGWESQSGVFNTTSRVVRALNFQVALDIVIAHAEMEDDFKQLVSGQVTENYVEDRIINIAKEMGYELSDTEVLGVMHEISVDDPTDDDIYLWVLIVCKEDIDWAGVKQDATLTDPTLISLLERNS